MRIKMFETRNFKVPTDWRVTIKFKADCEYTTKREWGEALVKAGVAVELGAPPRPQPKAAARTRSEPIQAGSPQAEDA